MKKTIRVLLAKTGLDSHTRGIYVIARALRDSGMEVIYTGPYQTIRQVVEAAIQEDVDVIGVTSMVGAHMTIFPEIHKLLEENKAAHILLIAGGFIPEEDAEVLKGSCVSEVFRVGTKTDDVVKYIRDKVGSQGERVA